MPNNLDNLVDMVDHLEDSDRRKYSALDPDDVKALGPAAALIELKGREVWLPYSQLRDNDGQLCASNWILEQKGIEV